MGIISKFQTGEVINFDGKSYEVATRKVQMDLDLLDSGYYNTFRPLITYDLKPYWRLQGHSNLYGVTESEIIEDMRITAYHSELKNKQEMSEGK